MTEAILLPPYHGYIAEVSWEEDDSLFVGKLSGISDLVLFHAIDIEHLEAAFHDAVEDYLDFCKEIHKKPQIPSNQ